MKTQAELNLQKTKTLEAVILMPISRFNVERVKVVVSEVLDGRLKNKVYKAKESSQLVKEMSSELLVKVAEMEFDNYKIMVQVTIGELQGQGCHIGSRGLWDNENDNYASVSFQNESLYCVATVFGCYSP